MKLLGLFYVTTSDVRTSRWITKGAITFAVIRDSSVHMVVVLRVLSIRFRGFVIQARSMNSFSRSFSVTNNCFFGPSNNFFLFSVKRFCPFNLVACRELVVFLWYAGVEGMFRPGGEWRVEVTTVAPTTSTDDPRKAT